MTGTTSKSSHRFPSRLRFSANCLGIPGEFRFLYRGTIQVGYFQRTQEISVSAIERRDWRNELDPYMVPVRALRFLIRPVSNSSHMPAVRICVLHMNLQWLQSQTTRYTCWVIFGQSGSTIEHNDMSEKNSEEIREMAIGLMRGCPFCFCNWALRLTKWTRSMYGFNISSDPTLWVAPIRYVSNSPSMPANPTCVCIWISNDYTPNYIELHFSSVLDSLFAWKKEHNEINEKNSEEIRSMAMGNLVSWEFSRFRCWGLIQHRVLTPVGKYLDYPCSLVVFFLTTGMIFLKFHVQTSTVREITTCDWFGSYSNSSSYSKDQDDHYGNASSNQETPNRFHPRG